MQLSNFALGCLLFCFKESKSFQNHTLSIRCEKALVNLVSKVHLDYNWPEFPTSLEHQENSEISTEFFSITSFPDSSVDLPDQEQVPWYPEV